MRVAWRERADGAQVAGALPGEGRGSTGRSLVATDPVASSYRAGQALAIVEVRRRRLTQARIARSVGVSASTVSRVLTRAGLSQLADLEPSEPLVRYEHAAPATCCISIPRSSAASSGQAIASPATHATTSTAQAGSFCSWRSTTTRASASRPCTPMRRPQRVLSCASRGLFHPLGVTVRRVLTDNGAAFRSKEFAAACNDLDASTIHPRLPAADQRQSRALHPVGVAGVGLRLPYQNSQRTPLDAGIITTTGTARIKVSVAPHPCPDSVQKEPLDASQD